MYNSVGFFSILLILYINNFNVVIKQMQKTYFYTKKKKKNPWCWNNHARTKSEDLNEDRDTL